MLNPNEISNSLWSLYPYPTTTSGDRVLYYDEENQTGSLCCVVQERIYTTDWSDVYVYNVPNNEGEITSVIFYCVVDDVIYEVTKSNSYYHKTDTVLDIDVVDHERLIGDVVYRVQSGLCLKTEVDITDVINSAKQGLVIVQDIGKTTTGETAHRLSGKDNIPAYCTVTDDEGNEIHYAVVTDQYLRTSVKIDVDPMTCEEFDVKIRYKILKEAVAHINTDNMHINKAVIDTSLGIGGLEWSIRENGNVGILWKGAD